ncbi:MAG: family 43 glycosylhydrolase, partial [Pseudobutyrivibrio sp.]|nr:family 43 glycosylhydrolase [Pseudobutyrivibrio sp.]
FDFWDPNLFVDEDGRVYFYWGCSALDPIWGVEKDPVTMKNIGEPKELIFGQANVHGYERVGDNNSERPLSDEEIDATLEMMMKQKGMTPDAIKAAQPTMYYMARGFVSKRPYIEGAWMDKFKGKYYLQYAFAGSQYNTYGDGVYVSDSPLGPFELAENNPYSYKPSGFMNGAGHGSTMTDLNGNIWHTATMRISVNHNFERRVGLWPAGVDKDGNLFCNQRYGDWPMSVNGDKEDPWRNPQWMLLSYKASAEASSAAEGHGAELISDENCRTWWMAGSNKPGEWISLDLGKAMDVRAIQINFADDKLEVLCPGEVVGTTQARYIDGRDHVTRYTLEGSVDGSEYFMIEDKHDTDTDCPHDFLVREDGFEARFLKLTVFEVPYNQTATVSGIRVFGNGSGSKPKAPSFDAERISDLQMEVTIAPEEDDAVGYNILWGSAPDKLYHSWMTFEKSQVIPALVKDRHYYVRVDAFNESGITEGPVLTKLI